MATIHTIKDNILKMEAGEFQNLCDSFLMKEGYRNNIVSYGSQPGTRKTVKGTPDTYFRSENGKYALVEYTTVRENLFAKIKSDIEKCLKEDLPNSEIEEIIYFHTSSRLTTEQDRQLHNQCETYGISLRLIGIDMLAEVLHLRYPRLVRDFLGLSIDTEQIQSVEDFVKQYNAPVLAAPLDIPFLFREEELKAISTAFQSRNVVVLKGAAGNGKTRLALQFAEDYAEKHEMKLYCIRDKSLPLFEDLRTYLTSPGKYFIVVDDANELTGLKHVLQYATDAMPNVAVKILATVRDYAYEKISRDIASMVEAETIEVGVMTDEQLITLLKKEFGIHNPLYQKRILQIARGNARLAVLAGKLACVSNDLQSIEDATQFYDRYYQDVLNTLHGTDNRDLFVCAGIIAFLERMRIDQLDSYRSLLTLANVSDEVFVAATQKLHGLEIVNIFQDKAVVFADQCLKNYLIKYVFCDRKFISLQRVIEICFSTFQNQTIQMVSMLLNIFNNETFEKQVTEAVKSVWKRLEQENSPLFDSFVQSFYPINQIEALVLQKRKIDSMDCVDLPADQIDTETGRDNQTRIDSILRVLGGVFCLEQGNIAMDLFFEYYRKRPDLYMCFYQTFKYTLSINTTTAIALAYDPQKLFLQKLRTHSDGWKYPAFIVLFWEVAKELLEFAYSPIEPGEAHQITISHISLEIDEGVKTYRHFIWKSMLEICAISGQEKHALKMLRNYGGTIEKCSIPVLTDDQEFIIPVLDLLQPRNALQVGLVAERLIGIYDSHQIDSTAFEKYLQVETMRIYRIVVKPDPYILHKHPEREQQYAEELVEYARSLSIQKVEQLHELAIALVADNDRQYRFFYGLTLLFENLASNAKLYRQTVACYLRSNTPGYICADTLIELLFRTMSAEDVWMLINRYDYDQKTEWQYAYYRVIPDAWIT